MRKNNNNNRRLNPLTNSEVIAPEIVLTKEEITHQIKRISLLLGFFLSILIFINVLHVYALVGYSQQETINERQGTVNNRQDTVNTDQGTTNTRQNVTNTDQDVINTQQQIQNKQQGDVISTLFNNSLTQMLMSTFIIAIVGVLITKLRGFKKKLDMIEVLSKALVKFKKQADEREANFEKRLKEYRDETDKEIEALNKRIEVVKDEATKALIDYLRSNSVDRKR